MGPASESFVSSHLMIDSVWEDMNDDGHRIFCWLPDPWSTQCGKTGVATAKSKLFVTCVEFCPTVGRSATGLVSILITAKIWHSCGKLHCIVSPHVALTASSIYAFCPFAARYFSASEREACVARRPSEVSGSEALAILMFLRNTLQRIVFHMFHA